MDPLDGASRWHQWTVSGPKHALDQVLPALDARLPAGWRRLAGEALDPFRSLVREGAGWYALDTTPKHVGVTLSVEPRGATEIRGGRVWFSGPPYPIPQPSIPASWDQVNLLLDLGIVPAARAAGADVRLPTPEDLFAADLPADVRARLNQFSNTARKILPLNREEAGLWHAFTVAAFRSKTVIDARQFVNWLCSQGWSKEGAAELNLRFLDQSLLLSKYADEVSVA